MEDRVDRRQTAEQIWGQILTQGNVEHLRQYRRIFKFLPKEPRCVTCNAPFEGIGAAIIQRAFDIRQSNFNPKFCNNCELLSRKYPGGAEIELAMLFADVRGSTTLAERIGRKEFAHLIQRFYRQAGEVLIQSDAMIEKLIGDELTGLYVPGFAGVDYTRKALEAARHLMKVTGHTDGGEPWVPIGIGIHKGKAFVGVIGSTDGLMEFTALGDAVNVAARLSQLAKPGEIIISEEACLAAGMPCDEMECHKLSLKGRKETVNAYSIRVGTNR